MLSIAGRRAGSGEQRRLAPAERTQVVDAKVRFARHQELVELRRAGGGAGEHRVRLAAVGHLVVEQVGDDVGASSALTWSMKRWSEAACAAAIVAKGTPAGASRQILSAPRSRCSAAR